MAGKLSVIKMPDHTVRLVKAYDGPLNCGLRKATTDTERTTVINLENFILVLIK